MARTKNKVRRVTAFINNAQAEALDILMAESMTTNTSQYIGRLIAERWTQRTEDRSRRPVGRPRKEDGVTATEPEEERFIPHPDRFMNRGKLLTPTEYEEWWENHPGYTPKPGERLLPPHYGR